MRNSEGLTAYQEYKREQRSLDRRAKVMPYVDFARAQERERLEQETLPARYAWRESILAPPLSMQAWEDRRIRLRREYSAKLRILRDERAKIENEWALAAARAHNTDDIRECRRMMRDEGNCTRAMVAALKAEYAALMK